MTDDAKLQLDAKKQLAAKTETLAKAQLEAKKQLSEKASISARMQLEAKKQLSEKAGLSARMQLDAKKQLTGKADLLAKEQDITLSSMAISDPTILSIRSEIDYRPIEGRMVQPGYGIGIQDVEGKANTSALEGGVRKALSSISWTCVTNQGNRLFYNGSPFRAKCLVFEATNISWQAGAGHPVYTTYCPQPDYSASMWFRDAKRHQIVPVYGGVYWTGCFSHAKGCGSETTDVLFWVNDDKYDDNTGTFNLTVTGWS